MIFTGKISTGAILGHLIFWLFIIIVTLGVGLFFAPYSFAKFIINHTEVEIGGQRHKLRCEVDIMSQIGHIILWAIISILTLGIGYFFYLYKVWNIAMSNTTGR